MNRKYLRLIMLLTLAGAVSACANKGKLLSPSQMAFQEEKKAKKAQKKADQKAVQKAKSEDSEQEVPKVQEVVDPALQPEPVPMDGQPEVKPGESK